MKRLSEQRMRPIRDEVYDLIRQAIISGQYRPGDKLPEEELAEELGVSRTPVREALRKLEVENFVQHFSHRGVVVSQVNTAEILDLYEVRTHLECMLIRKAAQRATAADIVLLRKKLDQADAAQTVSRRLEAVEEFNDLLLRLSGSQQVLELQKRTREMLQRAVVSGHADPVRSKTAAAEHRAIVDALEARDPDLAERLVREHLSNSSGLIAAREREKEGGEPPAPEKSE